VRVSTSKKKGSATESFPGKKKVRIGTRGRRFGATKQIDPFDRGLIISRRTDRLKQKGKGGSREEKAGLHGDFLKNTTVSLFPLPLKKRGVWGVGREGACCDGPNAKGEMKKGAIYHRGKKDHDVSRAGQGGGGGDHRKQKGNT